MKFDLKGAFNGKPDEVEKAIIKAFSTAGDTTKGRKWYTPTAIVVHTCAWASVAANSLGQYQMAGLIALVYGLVDIYGFSGSIRLAVNAKNQMEKKAKQAQQQQPPETVGDLAKEIIKERKKENEQERNSRAREEGCVSTAECSDRPSDTRRSEETAR